MNDCLNHQLAREDVDVILAALRLLQHSAGGHIPDAIQEIAGDSLAVVDISHLCERLNFDGCEDDQGECATLIRRLRAELSRPEWNADTFDSLSMALAGAGWPMFTPENEGWYLDVVDGVYDVVACSDGPFRSKAEAIAAIERRFAAGSHWHGQVLDTIGMTACGRELTSN